MVSFLEVLGLEILVVFVAVRLLLRLGQRVIHSGRRRDRVRIFPLALYRQVMNRAGRRCEHHSLIFGRCKATDQLEADHIHPHSRGGQTALQNGQALCRRHNRWKRAKVPFWWNIQALQRRRRTYFPSWADVHVVRRGP